MEKCAAACFGIHCAKVNVKHAAKSTPGKDVENEKSYEIFESKIDNDQTSMYFSLIGKCLGCTFHVDKFHNKRK